MPTSDITLLKQYLVKMAVYLTVWLAGQTCGAIWWAAAINTRVGQLERLTERVECRVHALELSGSQWADRAHARDPTVPEPPATPRPDT
jgi:hypothetical protein